MRTNVTAAFAALVFLAAVLGCRARNVPNPPTVRVVESGAAQGHGPLAAGETGVVVDVTSEPGIKPSEQYRIRVIRAGSGREDNEAAGAARLEWILPDYARNVRDPRTGAVSGVFMVQAAPDATWMAVFPAVDAAVGAGLADIRMAAGADLVPAHISTPGAGRPKLDPIRLLVRATGAKPGDVEFVLLGIGWTRDPEVLSKALKDVRETVGSKWFPIVLDVHAEVRWKTVLDVFRRIAAADLARVLVDRAPRRHGLESHPEDLAPLTLKDRARVPDSLLPKSPATAESGVNDTFGTCMDVAADAYSDAFRGYVRGLNRTGFDIVICFDSTGTMGGVIHEFKTRIRELVRVVTYLVPNARIGIVTYRDWRKYDPDDYEYLLKYVPLQDCDKEGRNKLQLFLRECEAYGGGDVPEAVQAGVEASIDKAGWRPGAKRIIIVVGDAPPHPEVDGLKYMFNLCRKWKDAGGTLSCIDTTGGGKLMEEFKRMAEEGGGAAASLEDERKVIEKLVLFAFGSTWEREIDEVTKRVRRLPEELDEKFLGEPIGSYPLFD